MAIKQTANLPRVEVKARISTDLHRRLVEECGLCGCHMNGVIAIAIAREVAYRRNQRKKETDAYIERIIVEAEKETHAKVNP